MSRGMILKLAAAVCVVAVLVCGLVVFAKTARIGISYEDADRYTAGAATLNDTVKNLDIDWVDGAVTIAYHAQDTVEIAETSKNTISDDARLRWWLDGDTLRVRYAKSGFFTLRGLDKALTVTLPEGAALEGVLIDATAADVIAPKLQAKDVAVSLTSGSLDLEQTGQAERVGLTGTAGNIRAVLSDVGELSASTTAGDIELSFGAADSVAVSVTAGSIAATGDSAKQAAFDSTSGSIRVELNAFDDLQIDATAGSVTAALPSEPGYRANIDTTAGSFDYTVPLKREDKAYVCGDGSATLRIDTTAGNVVLKEIGE